MKGYIIGGNRKDFATLPSFTLFTLARNSMKTYSTIGSRTKNAATSYITRISCAPACLDVLSLRVGGGISIEEKGQERNRRIHSSRLNEPYQSLVQGYVHLQLSWIISGSIESLGFIGQTRHSLGGTIT